mmetsp:Transcript_110193/g.296638  ORF Transcript_110193/g.296638 Transcript_110193/m.296638 type:complete len:462 (+) Transcript_110193:526-1911(+)
MKRHDHPRPIVLHVIRVEACADHVPPPVDHVDLDERGGPLPLQVLGGAAHIDLLVRRAQLRRGAGPAGRRRLRRTRGTGGGGLGVQAPPAFAVAVDVPGLLLAWSPDLLMGVEPMPSTPWEDVVHPDLRGQKHGLWILRPADKPHAHRVLEGLRVQPAALEAPRPLAEREGEGHPRQPQRPALVRALPRNRGRPRGRRGDRRGGHQGAPSGPPGACTGAWREAVGRRRCSAGRHCRSLLALLVLLMHHLLRLGLNDRGRRGRRQRHGIRLDEACELDGPQHLDMELGLRDACDLAQLLCVPHLEGSDEDAVHLQKSVEVLRLRVRARTQVDPVVSGREVHIQLVNVADRKLDAPLVQRATALPRVRHGLGPDLDAVVRRQRSDELGDDRVEVTRARADVEERHARGQRQQRLQGLRIYMGRGEVQPAAPERRVRVGEPRCLGRPEVPAVHALQRRDAFLFL